MSETIQQPYQPAPELIIDDLETLKVLADPLRLRILELLGKPRTVKQVAGELGIAATKLYYHVNLLEKQGLIRTVDTRIVSGIIEKHYQIAARSYRVKHGLFTPGTPEYSANLNMTLSTLFDNAKAEIQESIQAGVIDTSKDAPDPSTLNMSQLVSCLTPEQADIFFRKLEELGKEFLAYRHQGDGADQQFYRLMIVGYPTSRRPPPDEPS